MLLVPPRCSEVRTASPLGLDLREALGEPQGSLNNAVALHTNVWKQFAEEGGASAFRR